MSKDLIKENGDKVNFELEVLNQLENISIGSTSPDGLVPVFLRVSDSGTIEGNVASISFANSGAINVTVLGTILKPNEGIGFDGSKYSSDAFTYDATGGELIITYAY